MSLQTVRRLPSTTWPIAQANGCSTSHKRAGSLAWRPADSGSNLCRKTFGYLLRAIPSAWNRVVTPGRYCSISRSVSKHGGNSLAFRAVLRQGRLVRQQEATMLKAYFDQLAQYNRWANRRLYGDAASLPDAERKRSIGLFFGSVHGTLNHLLVADYIWMRRMIGEGPQPERLSQILYDNFAALRAARAQEDDRICEFVTVTDESGYDRIL